MATNTRKRTALSSGTARKIRRLEFAKRLAPFVLGTVFFTVLFFSVLYRPEFNIREITVSGASVLKTEEIISSAREELSGKYFYLIPKSSSFFYPKEKIAGKLRNNFERIRDLSVSRNGLNVLFIRLSERPEVYLWCGRDFPGLRDPSVDCYFIDSGGYVFSKAPYYSGNMFLEFYGPLAEGENMSPIGGTVMPENVFRSIVAFSESLKSLDLPPQKILSLTDGDFELYLPVSGKIIISGKNDVSKATDYLRPALSANPLRKNMAEDREGLEYLDLRFGNKVYFKFR